VQQAGWRQAAFEVGVFVFLGRGPFLSWNKPEFNLGRGAIAGFYRNLAPSEGEQGHWAALSAPTIVIGKKLFSVWAQVFFFCFRGGFAERAASATGSSPAGCSNWSCGQSASRGTRPKRHRWSARGKDKDPVTTGSRKFDGVRHGTYLRGRASLFASNSLQNCDLFLILLL